MVYSIKPFICVRKQLSFLSDRPLHGLVFHFPIFAMTTSLVSHPRLHIALRIATALLGGYVFTWGFMALGMAGLFALGLEFHDAESLSAIVGILLYLAVFLWAFAARSLRRVWLVLAGGGALMAGAASLVQWGLV